MSFNFGPTLLNWLEKYNTEVYQKIIDADKLSLKLFNNHGGAIAQVYNHIIMPLAKLKDKIVQVEWGIRDFEKRFKRKPEGMWLAETAVDTETLEVLYESGIKFTILSPYQAKSVFVKNKYIDIENGSIDYTKPYKIKLSGDKEINVIFYEGYLSKSIAFDDLLKNGDKLMNSIESKFKKDSEDYQIVTLATDGETFGHHKKFGELALTYIFEHIEQNKNINMTNISEFLSIADNYQYAEIVENSSWSCAHGIERWRSDCGCKIDTGRDWNQKWREYLRKSFDYLKSEVDKIFYNKIVDFINKDQVDNLIYEYVNLFSKHNKTEKDVQIFMKKFNLKSEYKKEFFDLLEMFRYSEYMFTSCGWFFDDISGIEAQQILKYAYFTLDKLEQYNNKIEKKFLDLLEKSVSNDEEYKNGKFIYKNEIKLTKYYLSLIVCVGFAYKNYNVETKSEFTLFDYNIKFLKLKNNNNDITALIEVIDKTCFIKNYFVVKTKNKLNLYEKYYVKNVTDNFNEIKISDLIHADFEGYYSYIEFPIDSKILIFEKYINNKPDEYINDFESMYQIIEFFKINIDNPKGYLKPVIKGMIKEYVFRKLVYLIETENIDELEEFIETVLEWETEFINKKIYNYSSSVLKQILNRFIKSLKPDYHNEKDLIKFYKMIQVLDKLNIDPDFWNLQNFYYDFLQKFNKNKSQYSENIIKIINKLSEFILTV
jgi:hypothetical protein